MLKLILHVLALAASGSAHYHFGHLIVNGTVTPKWKYVRNPAPDPGYASTPGLEEFAKIAPFYDMYSPFMKCGRDSGSGPNTSTATVLAGTEIGFRLADIWKESDTIFHDGPGQVYLSKAPNGDVEHYDGSGDWFKIAVAGAANDTEWKLYLQNQMLFKIPEKTPPGKYLLRIEHFEPRWALDASQWYVSCAHVDILGLGGGEPTHFVTFPGGYDMFDPGIWITRAHAMKTKLMSYIPPGPPVWTG